jgi:cytochrome P450
MPVFGHGIFTTDGKEWEASRALLRPNFVRNQVADMDTFDHHISAMISRIPKDGSTVDLQALFFMLTLDSATEFLFGTSTAVLEGGIANERGNQFSEAFGYATEKVGFKNRLGKLADVFPDKKFKDSTAFIHDYIHSYVQKAVDLHNKTFVSGKPEEESSRYIFLEQLAKAGYSEKKIQDELLNILLAGRDTTAGLLSYMFYYLARRPDVFSKLRAEVMALGASRPTFEQIKGMKYLQYCKYIPSVFPAIFLLQRLAIKSSISSTSYPFARQKLTMWNLGMNESKLLIILALLIMNLFSKYCDCILLSPAMAAPQLSTQLSHSVVAQTTNPQSSSKLVSK